jgi:GNAT superfamily N-acetyltransferase
VQIRPLTKERLGDLAELFGSTAVTNRCYCTWFLMLDPRRREVWAADGSRQVFERFAGAQNAPVGVLAYDAGRPVGWCAAAPRSEFPRLVRSKAWLGGDPDAWVVTCFFIHRSARHAGLSRALLDAAATLAAEHGAAAIEGVPRGSGVPTSPGDGYVGFEQTFADCGFTVVARPDAKRVRMRRELSPAGPGATGS